MQSYKYLKKITTDRNNNITYDEDKLLYIKPFKYVVLFSTILKLNNNFLTCTESAQ